MGIERSTEIDNQVLIRVSGRFDFSCHAGFRECYAGAVDGIDFVVDMAAATYMDSAALGMLLLLREHAQQHGSKVAITNCTGQTREVLQIANFHRLFKIQ